MSGIARKCVAAAPRQPNMTLARMHPAASIAPLQLCMCKQVRTALTRQSTPWVPLSRLLIVSLFQLAGYSNVYLAANSWTRGDAI